MKKQKANESFRFLLSIEYDGNKGADASVKLKGKTLEILNALTIVYDSQPKLKKILEASIAVHNQLLEDR